MPKCNACDKRATFNIASEKIAKFCKEHKTSDMIDVVKLRFATSHFVRFCVAKIR